MEELWSKWTNAYPFDKMKVLTRTENPDDESDVARHEVADNPWIRVDVMLFQLLRLPRNTASNLIIAACQITGSQEHFRQSVLFVGQHSRPFN